MSFFKRIPTTVLLFFFFFSIYLATMSGWIQFGDEIEKYRVAQSLVERGQLSYRPTAIRNVTGVDRQTYSIYELGQTLLEVPLYALGKLAYTFFPTPDSNWMTQLWVGLLNPLLTALTGVVLFKTCDQLGFRYQTSLALTLVFGLGTIAFPYSKGFAREPLLALLLLGSFAAVCLYQKTMAERRLLVAGILTGYLAFSKFIHAVVIPIFLVYLLFVIYQDHTRVGAGTRERVRVMLRRLTIFLFPAAAFLGVQVLYSFVRFGTFERGFGTRGNPIEWILSLISQSEPEVATMGLLFSAEKGIFLYSPPLILFLVGWFRWARGKIMPAVLLMVLVIVEFISAIGRPDWDGGSWWGPRYVVQITPFMIIPIGALLESPSRSARKRWAMALGALFAVGFCIQLVGAFVDDRDYLDILGSASILAGQLDFLRRGALDALVIYFYTTGVQINPFGILLFFIVVMLGAGIVVHWRRGEAKLPRDAAWLLTGLFLLVELVGLVVWVAAPYSQVLAAKADTRFAAAQRFLVDSRKCEATGFLMLALQRQTNYQREAVEQIEQLVPRANGTRIPIDNPIQWSETPEGTSIEESSGVTLAGSSTKFTSASDASVSITSQPLPVQPNVQYQLSGWIKSNSIYGSGYGVVSIDEDDGNWESKRTTDVTSLDETNGWRPFLGTITTLPTTRRLFVKAGLYNTFGTLWVDGIQLIRVDRSVEQPKTSILPCKP